MTSKKVRAKSDSFRSSAAEVVVLNALNKERGWNLAQKQQLPVMLPTRGQPQIDGLDLENRVAVEVYTGLDRLTSRGALSPGAKRKISEDAAKLSWLKPLLEGDWTLIVALTCGVTLDKYRRTYHAYLAERSGVDFVLVELDDQTRASLEAAKIDYQAGVKA